MLEDLSALMLALAIGASTALTVFSTAIYKGFKHSKSASL